ncbi:beta-lactamase-like protein [Lipomyces kononenkoae]
MVLISVGLQAIVGAQTTKGFLRVATYVNNGPAVDMVSSLIIGSQSAVIIDLPMTITKAKELASWVKATTDKPLVAAFTSHNHPDHYLSGAAFFEEFPAIPFYANSRATKEIQEDAPKKVAEWSRVHGIDDIVQNTTLPTAYDYSFFALPGDENSPIYIIGPVTGDTTHCSLFWIPSIGTLIAGDAIFGYNLHMYLSDMVTHALTQSWLDTLQFSSGLKPFTVIPGHASENGSFSGIRDLDHSYDYVKFWQEDIESRGPDFFTPTEIFNKFTARFPDLLLNRSPMAFNRLNITAENFGRGGRRRPPLQPLWRFNNTAALNGWIM